LTVYDRYKVPVIINAKGPATRLSGGLMRPEVSAAMVAASQHCVDMAELQAAASREIAKVTGAEAGYVASGASACLMLAAAACLAGLDPGRMARLPDTGGVKNEIVMVRSQRNFYDHALRAAGAKIIEVGLPDRYAGAGVRDAEAWELKDAITPNTVAMFYVADDASRPSLKDMVRVAHKHKLPVIVDAAAQLPPRSNLRKFISEGADLVAFSGGKALGGPQASGFLAGRRDLIMSAALQHLDLDVYDDHWQPPSSLIDRKKLKGIPPHGIGRSCKAGKEEIIGLLEALRLIVKEGDAARHAVWVKRLESVEAGLSEMVDVSIVLQQASVVPLLELKLAAGHDAGRIALKLQRAGVYVDASLRNRNMLLINPTCFSNEQVARLCTVIKTIFNSRK
jgi:D-glucosaminate-6-phosphate ammonia-lyase